MDYLRGGDVCKRLVAALEAKGTQRCRSRDSERGRTVQDGNGSKDGAQEPVAGASKLANGKVLWALVEPETNMKVAGSRRSFDQFVEGWNPKFVVKKSEVAR